MRKLLLTASALSLLALVANAQDQALGDFFHSRPKSVAPSPVPSPSSSAPAPVTAAPTSQNTCAQIGPQRIAVILANYDGSPSDAATPNADYVKELMLGTSHDFSVSNYYKTVSGGRTWFESVKILGPYHAPKPFVHDQSKVSYVGESLDKWEGSLLTLAQNDVDFTKIDRVVFITPEAIDPQGQPVEMAAGLAAQGTCDLMYSGPNGSRGLAHAWVRADIHYQQAADPHTVSYHPETLSPAVLQSQLRQRMMLDMAPIAHELGHTFGLGHANRVNRPEPGQTPTQFQNQEILPAADQTLYEMTYGDPFSEMSAGDIQWLNVAHLNHLGWLSPSEITEVRDDGTFRIYPLEGGSSITTALKGLKIPRAIQSKTEATKSFLWVEYRQGNSSYDTDLSGIGHVTDGALVHYTNPNQPGPNSMWPEETILLNFKIGPVSPYEKDYTLKGKWKDEHSQVQLEVLHVTPEYLDIHVSFVKP